MDEEEAQKLYMRINKLEKRVGLVKILSILAICLAAIAAVSGM